MNFNSYTILKTIPPKETGLSIVYPAKRGDKLYALKVAKSEEHDSLLRRSAAVQASLDHQNIVKVLDCQIDSERQRPFAVMPWIDWSTLHDALFLNRSVSFEQNPAAVLNIARQMMDAAGYAHSKRVIVGDLSPSNTFLSPNFQTKITDIGYVVNNGLANSQEIESGLIADPNYLAPEQRVSQSPKPSKQADAYAAAFCALQLVTGKQLPLLSENFADNNLRMFFEKGLAENPQQRATVSELSGMLSNAINGYSGCSMGDIKQITLSMINSGDLESAHSILNGTNLYDLQKILLRNALVTRNPIRSLLLKELSREVIGDTIVSIDPKHYKSALRFGALTNNVAVATAMYDPELAASLFKKLFGKDHSPSILNNLGAACAAANDIQGIIFLTESKLPESVVNEALLALQRKDLLKARNIALRTTRVPKTMAILLMTGDPPNKNLPLDMLAMKFAKQFRTSGVKQDHYEFILT